MALSVITGFTPIAENSDATPGLWNARLQQVQDNVNSLWTSTNSYLGNPLSSNTLRPESGSTISVIPTAALVAKSVDSGGAWWDVRAFGAVGDGSADDTTAIQAAISHCSLARGGTVFVPPGVYSVTSLRFPGNNITLRGAGSNYAYNTSARTATVIKARSGASSTLISLVETGGVEDRTGCHIVDLAVDGNSIASYGIGMAGANLLERVLVTSCKSAGVRLATFTNASRILHCGLNSNSGWGLVAEGAGTTPYSIVGSAINLNSGGGAALLAGVHVTVSDTIIESNGSAGLYLNHAETGAMFGFRFANVWFEDNAGPATVVVDSGQRSDASAPSWIRFEMCRFSTSSQSRHVDINSAKWLTFDHCNFTGSTHTNALTTSSEARHVALIESRMSRAGFSVDGLSDTQVDAFVATGTRCYVADRHFRRAPTFENSWVDLGSATSAGYWTDVQGVVHLQGSIASGTTTAAAFTLPAGYRSATTRRFIVMSNGGVGDLEVRPSGAVVPIQGSSKSFSLDGVSFPTL